MFEFNRSTKLLCATVAVAAYFQKDPTVLIAHREAGYKDPVTGKKTWEVVYKYPPMASLLTTKGGLVFVPGADGMFDALDAKTGEKLWSHNDGIGHDGGWRFFVSGD